MNENLPNSLPRVVIAIDRPGWAFHHIAEQIVRGLAEDDEGEKRYAFSILPYDEIKNIAADLLVCLWWGAHERLLADNMFRRSVVCIYDHYSWSGGHHDLFNLQCAISRADAIGVGNVDIAYSLNNRKLTGGKPVFLVEDGVDTELFRPAPLQPMLTLGWCGNAAAAHGAIKGLPLIRAAAKKSGVELRVLDVSATGEVMEHASMPAWYASLSAYVCASTMEGTPNPVLESLACGRPVITTRCGLTPRVVQDGVSGFFIERSVEGICAGIERLRESDQGMLGRAARRTALAYDWRLKMPAWHACISAALERML
jgi:hypothetical protein